MNKKQKNKGNKAMKPVDVRQKTEHDKLKNAVKKLEEQVASELLKNPVFKSMKERKLARSHFFEMLDNLMDAIGELESFEEDNLLNYSRSTP